MLGLAVFTAGAYANSIYLKWFYPNRLEETPFIPYESQNTVREEENVSLVPATGGEKEAVTCDTFFSVEEYDMLTETSVLRDEPVPGKYLGMEREEFLQAMEAYEMSPPLSEQERGFVSLEVLSFSSDRISVRKNYRMETVEPEPLFFLVCEDNYITVYEEDMRTVFLYTDISVEELPFDVQEEIMQKKPVSGEGALYHFLESYSS